MPCCLIQASCFSLYVPTRTTEAVAQERDPPVDCGVRGALPGATLCGFLFKSLSAMSFLASLSELYHFCRAVWESARRRAHLRFLQNHGRGRAPRGPKQSGALGDRALPLKIGDAPRGGYLPRASPCFDWWKSEGVEKWKGERTGNVIDRHRARARDARCPSARVLSTGETPVVPVRGSLQRAERPLSQ